MAMKAPPPWTGVKVYQQIRTAHLERLLKGRNPTNVLFKEISYDFDDAVANRAGVERATIFRLARRIIRKNVRIVEINEPLFLRAIPLQVIAVAAVFIRNHLFAEKAYVVTYAIENITLADKLKSIEEAHGHLPSRIAKVAISIIYRSIDRIAFGTSDANAAYQQLINTSRHRPLASFIEALDAQCPTCTLSPKDNKIVFLGAFEARKGIMELIDAWRAIRVRLPGWQLAILGKGVLEDAVLRASSEMGTSVMLNPSREEIHAQLASARILCLPSQSTLRWKEQIGLPILEGLSHGCRIVTTSGTGLATELRSMGHFVAPEGNHDALCSALFDACKSDLSERAIVEALPKRGGRETAEDWLWRIQHD